MLGIWPVIQLCYNAFNLTVYCLFIVTVIQCGRGESPTFTHSFFAITLDLALIDIVSTFNKLLINLRMWNFWPNTFEYYEKNFALQRILYFLSWYLPYNQVSALQVLAVNRYTAIRYPLQYGKVASTPHFIPVLQGTLQIWQQKTLVKCFVIHWILPFVISAPLLVYIGGVWVPENNDTSAYNVFIYDYPKVAGLYYLLDAVVFTVVLISQLVLYWMMYCSSRANRVNDISNVDHPTTNPSSITTTSSLEANYTLFGLTMTLITGIIGVYSLISVYAYSVGLPTSVEAFLEVYIYSITYDLLTFANPYLMLMCSSKVRANFFKLIMCDCRELH